MTKPTIVVLALRTEGRKKDEIEEWLPFIANDVILGNSDHQFQDHLKEVMEYMDHYTKEELIAYITQVTSLQEYLTSAIRRAIDTSTIPDLTDFFVSEVQVMSHEDIALILSPYGEEVV